MKERDLREPVHAWLSPTGKTKVIYEFMMAGYCDMVGVLFAKREGRAIPEVLRATAVELKLVDIAGAISQALDNRWHVHASYIAMPTERCQRMMGATRLRILDAGVGLLSVGLCVEELIVPAPLPPQFSPEDFRKRWWHRVVRDERLRRQAAGEPKCQP